MIREATGDQFGRLGLDHESGGKQANEGSGKQSAQRDINTSTQQSRALPDPQEALQLNPGLGRLFDRRHRPLLLRNLNYPRETRRDWDCDDTLTASSSADMAIASSASASDDQPPPRPAPMEEAHPLALGSPIRTSGSPNSASPSRRKPVPRLDANHPFASPAGSSQSHSTASTSEGHFEPALPVPSLDPLAAPPSSPRRMQASSSSPSPNELQPSYSNDSLASLASAPASPILYRKDRKMSEVEWANILANRPDPALALNKPLPDFPRLESMDTLRFQRESSGGRPSSVRHSDESSEPPLTPEPAHAATWDVAQEIAFIDGQDKPTWATSAPGSPLRAYGKKKKSLSVPKEPFDVHAVPSKQRLWEAGTCQLKDQDGNLVRFSELFDGASRSECKTVVFFIRHFWCGQCQDYMFASLSQLDPEAVAKAGINVVIISNGSWKIIKKYRELFKCPFPIYVDGPRRLYQLMGMTKMTNDFGSMKNRAAYHQRAVPGQLVHGIGNGLFKMPIRDPGTLTQLGGEFVLGPGWQCSFAHRMTNTSDHMEAPDVLKLAGCEAPTFDEHAKAIIDEAKREELAQLEKEMDAWREGRETELQRIRRCKAERRGQSFTADDGGDLDARFRAVMMQDETVDVSAEREVTIIV